MFYKWNLFFNISHFLDYNPLFFAQTGQVQEIGRWSASGLASQPWAAELLALKLREESHAITWDINHVLQKHSAHHEHIPSLSLSFFFSHRGLTFFSKIIMCWLEGRSGLADGLPNVGYSIYNTVTSVRGLEIAWMP